MHNLDRLIQSFIDQHAALGASVALLRDGEVVYLGGFGTTSVEDIGVRVTPQTLFAYGSICKSLCATLVMRLVELDLLDLDNLITTYLPDFHFSNADLGARVTLRHILSHTTGLPAAGKDWGPRDPDSLRRFVYEQVPHYTFLSEPGVVHLYSNTVFCIAGYLAEVVTGKHYDNLMQEYVFDPLQMHRVTFDPAVALTYSVALPHTRNEDGTLRVAHRMPYNVSGNPSSFALGTAEDLAHLAQMYLNQGRYGEQHFLAASSIAEMHNLHASKSITSAANAWVHINEGYGLGFNVGNYRTHRAARHGGMSLSYNCFFDLFPDDRAGVVLLTNQCDDEKLLELVVALYDSVLGLPNQGMVYLPKPIPQPLLDIARTARRYTGAYVRIETGDVAIVSVEDQSLVLERHGQRAALVPIGNNEFYVDVSETYRLPVAFLVDVNGSATHAMVGGEPYHPITIDRTFQPEQAQLLEYEGVYKDPSNSNHEDTFTVFLNTNTLVIAQGTKEYRCTAVSDSCFLSELGMIEFVRSGVDAVHILIAGKATRYYPLNTHAYHTRGEGAR